MREGRAWRGLAVTHAVVSAVQAYLAVAMGVVWAAAIACGIAAH